MLTKLTRYRKWFAVERKRSTRRTKEHTTTPNTDLRVRDDPFPALGEASAGPYIIPVGTPNTLDIQDWAREQLEKTAKESRKTLVRRRTNLAINY